jgi:O-antigen/teichoic acid export membrane protein
LFLIGAAGRGVVIAALLRRRLLAGIAIPASSLRRGVSLALEAGYIGLFRMLRMVRNRVDVILVGTLIAMPLAVAPEAWNPDEARGLYAQAVRVVVIFHTLTLAFTTAIFPRLVRQTADAGRLEDARASYRTAVDWQAWWAAPLAAGLFFYADVVCGWFGPQYRDGLPALGLHDSTADVLRVLLVAVFLDCVGGPVGAVMMGLKDMEKRMPWIGAAIAGTSVVMNVILIPRYGLMGAAWASVCAALVEFGLKIVLVARLFGNPLPLLGRIVPHSLLAAGMIGLLIALDLGERAILGGLIGAAAYAAASLACGLVHPTVRGKVFGLLRR